MDLKVIHDTLTFYLDKFQMGWFSPQELDSRLDRAQMLVFNEFLPQYALNQNMQDNLTTFKAQYVFTNVTSANGLVHFPADYQSLIAVETSIIDGTTAIFPPVELLSEAQISERKSSQITPVTNKYPVGLLKPGGFFQIYPAVATAGTVYYFRRPKAPEFVYTNIGREVIYDDLASIQLEWNETVIDKIIFRALGLLGINLQAGDVIQLAEFKDKAVA